jgi:3-hydroxyisobutyryl-CoA hydrolase
MCKDFFRYEYLLDYTLTRVDPILVALRNGFVMGGGFGLSIDAPIRVATDSTVFAMPGKYNLNT